MTADEYRNLILDLAIVQSRLMNEQGEGVVYIDRRDQTLIAACLKNVLGMTLETAQAWNDAR